MVKPFSAKKFVLICVHSWFSSFQSGFAFVSVVGSLVCDNLSDERKDSQLSDQASENPATAPHSPPDQRHSGFPARDSSQRKHHALTQTLAANGALERE